MAQSNHPIEEPLQKLDELPDSLTDLLVEAQRANATDVHIDPRGDEYTIRFRVDGVIQQHDVMDVEKGEHLINQLKVAGQFTPDRAVLPLEGRLQWTDGIDEFAARITVMPTTETEAAHLRLLKPPEAIIEPEILGFTESDLEGIRTTLRKPEGLILISGPTGAGKTMTLYSLASMLDANALVTTSIEDPIEYRLDGVRQAQVDHEHGLTMHDGLTALLRMDPDIVIIGEVRDSQSAMTAVRAAASGRFVLATVHAREPALAIQMLTEYAVPAHLIGGTLRLVISQELLRRLCPECAVSRAPEEYEKELFERAHLECPDSIKDPKGCEKCHDYGYKGRVGVFQIVTASREIRRQIVKEAEAARLRDAMHNEGVHSMLHNALVKVQRGVTSVYEATRLYGVEADLAKK